MSVIYQPKGKAREYSPLACNIYSGCNHGCKYCYALGKMADAGERGSLAGTLLRNAMLAVVNPSKKMTALC